jgi:phospholipid/cholesterol/gamma-HCH transport system permease protein
MTSEIPDTESTGTPPGLQIERREDGRIGLSMSGDWLLAQKRPGAADFLREVEGSAGVTGVVVDGAAIGKWDTGLLVFLMHVGQHCADKAIPVDASTLPEGARRLFDLATSVPEHTGTDEHEELTILERVGETTLEFASGFEGMLAYVGDVTIAFGRLFTGRARMRKRDITLFIQETGFEALPIVSLISLLVGLILAFIGAVQLEQFGAQIYVANLVGLAMTREMGAMMTAIIMAGRTGAAFAAQLGTMEVNEEIDAFRTEGISPVEYLVLPRILALTLMMPLLALYSDFVGIIGGLFVGVTMLDLSFTQYMDQTREALGPMQFLLGVIKATLYGVAVAMAGCYYGMRSGRSAAAVGTAVTSAVVMGILLILILSAITTMVYNQLGI